jgi:hypothetical protein
MIDYHISADAKKTLCQSKSSMSRKREHYDEEKKNTKTINFIDYYFYGKEKKKKSGRIRDTYLLRSIIKCNNVEIYHDK